MAAIHVDRLTFAHHNQEPALEDVALHLPPGSRTILVGANGGKPRRSNEHASCASMYLVKPVSYSLYFLLLLLLRISRQIDVTANPRWQTPRHSRRRRHPNQRP